MKRKFFAALLASSMLLSAAACADADKPDTDGTIDSIVEVNDETIADAENVELETPLPTAPLTDMNGKNINIFVQQWYNYQPLYVTDIVVEEQTGVALNDMAFDRNMLMMDKLNCTVTMYENESTEITAFLNAVASDDDSFDFIIARGENFKTLLSADALMAVDNLPYFDAESPWWDKNAHDAFAINGKHYSMIGDITSNTYLSLQSIFFNKEMTEKYQLGDMYALVDEGKWTLDVMYQYGQVVSEDLNNDGKWTTDDQYGLTYVGSFPNSLLISFGVVFAAPTEDGGFDVLIGNEDSLTKMMKLSEIIKDIKVSLNHHKRSTNAYQTEVGCFVQGRVLFNQGAFYYAPEVRAMDQEFGIIPMPKYDEAQENYLCPIGEPSVPFICVPITCKNPDQISTFLEWYAYYGYELIRPEMIDVLLQRKVARDEESLEYVQYIFEHKTYDIGRIYDFGKVHTKVKNMLESGGNSFASAIEKAKTAIETDIADLLEMIG